MKNITNTSILALLLAALPAVAADIRVLARGEHVGTDIVYHYTLVNNGLGKPAFFHIGLRDAGDGGTPDSPGVYGKASAANSLGTLTRWPTGTTFVPDPKEQPTSYHYEPAVVPAGSVTTPSAPPGWVFKAYGFKNTHAHGQGHGIGWIAPEVFYRSPADSKQGPPTGADAGQTLSGFSVRVPAGASDYGYMTGGFEAEVWFGDDWFGRTKEQQIFAAIEKQDTLPPVLSVTLTPNILPNKDKLVAIAATITVTDDFDPLPAIVFESITANEKMDGDDIKDAKFGTDDRAFKLKAEREGKNKAGRIYTVTYSATDGSGNKTTASATVTVPHDERKKAD